MFSHVIKLEEVKQAPKSSEVQRRVTALGAVCPTFTPPCNYHKLTQLTATRRRNYPKIVFNWATTQRIGRTRLLDQRLSKAE